MGQNKRQRPNVPRQKAIQQLSSVIDLQRQGQRERQKRHTQTRRQIQRQNVIRYKATEQLAPVMDLQRQN